ncbi:hypothetical protein GCM10018782_04420 [Streptomyces griseoaurantiacus]|nr:hypothetical protein GCM10018782_04420 [Streptomyces griseoaurantiacus]
MPRPFSCPSSVEMTSPGRATHIRAVCTGGGSSGPGPGIGGRDRNPRFPARGGSSPGRTGGSPGREGTGIDGTGIGRGEGVSGAGGSAGAGGSDGVDGAGTGVPGARVPGTCPSGGGSGAGSTGAHRSRSVGAVSGTGGVGWDMGRLPLPRARARGCPAAGKCSGMSGAVCRRDPAAGSATQVNGADLPGVTLLFP